MAPNPRVVKAFRAMRDIGICEEIVKPVLKNLLKLYDKNWELIEEENYRALADAIFEAEEMEAAKSTKKIDTDRELDEETQIHNEHDYPFKRSRSNDQDGGASLSMANSSPTIGGPALKKPKVEADELDEAHARQETNSEITKPETQSLIPQQLAKDKGKQPISPNSLPVPDVVDRTESYSKSSPMRLRDKGKEPLLPQKAPRDFKVISERPSQGVRIREPQVDGATFFQPKPKVPVERPLVKPKDGKLTYSVPQSKAAIPAIHPGSLPQALSSNGSASINEQAVQPSRSADDDDKDGGIPASKNGLAKIPDETLLNLDNVSYGEEKVSLSCNIQSDIVVTLPCISTVPSPCCCTDDTLFDVNSGGNCCKVDKEKELYGLGRSNSQNKMVIEKLHSTPDDISSLPDVKDITKGLETVVISLENKVNNESRPSFNYMSQNVLFQNAAVNFSITGIGDNCCSTCSGDCLSSSTPCVCSHEGGEYAYTSEGLVNEDFLENCISVKYDPQKQLLLYCKVCPLKRSKNEETVESCKGHLLRKFIKECWWKCGCNKKCGNRIVQRGISHKLQVFMTPGGKGWGLRTLEDLPKGAFVCEYVGEVLTYEEFCDRVSLSPSKECASYSVLLDADWGSKGILKDEEALCLDATHYGNVARFINHRCSDPTLIEIPVEVETPDHHYYHLALFTTRKVKALEELTWDYGIDFDDNEYPAKAFQCLCGSKFCRNSNCSTRSKSSANGR